MRLYKILFFIISSILIYGCKPIDPEKIDWKPEILAPIVKSNLELYDFEDLIFSGTAYNVDAGSLPIPGYIPNIPIPVPPISNLSLPADYLKLSTFFNLIVVDSAAITINFNNVFPIPIGQNTRLTIRDSVSKELIADHFTNREVPPGEKYEFDFLIFDKKISQTLEIKIEEFNSPGGSNLIFTDETLIINVFIQFVNLDWVEVENDVNYSDTSYSDIDFSLDGDSDPYTGTLSLFLDNNFPTEFKLRLDLYDDADNFIYSFFGTDGVTVDRGVVDPGGNVIENTKFELLDFIHTDDIPLIESAKKIQIIADFSTGSTPTVNIIDEESYIELIISGNVEVAVQDAGL